MWTKIRSLHCGSFSTKEKHRLGELSNSLRYKQWECCSLASLWCTVTTNMGKLSMLLALNQFATSTKQLKVMLRRSGQWIQHMLRERKKRSLVTMISVARSPSIIACVLCVCVRVCVRHDLFLRFLSFMYHRVFTVVYLFLRCRFFQWSPHLP